MLAANDKLPRRDHQQQESSWRGNTNDIQLHELIGVIYSTAVDPNCWPDLLERLSVLLSHYDQDDGVPGKRSEKKQLAAINTLQSVLEPHLSQALSLGRQTDSIARLGESSFGILEQLPLAILLVNQENRLHIANKKGHDLLRQKTLCIDREGRVATQSPRDTKMLHEMIGNVLKRSGFTQDFQETILQLDSDQPESKATLVVIGGNVFDASIGLAAILVVSPEFLPQPSPKELCRLYSLTKTEASLAVALVQGKTLNDQAMATGVSKNTVRNQLKAIFEKTGVNRQAELIRLILTGPAMIGYTPEKKVDGPGETTIEQVFREQIITLKDGRKLALGCYGDFSKKPIFLLQGIDGSRLEMPFNPYKLKRHKLFFVIPERPGFGISSPKPGRRLVDWPMDLEEAMDFFGWETYRLVGIHSGGAYALACGYRINQRVEDILLINSVGPRETLALYDTCNPFWRMTMAIARKHPNLFKSFVKLIIRGILLNTEAYLKLTRMQNSEREREMETISPGGNCPYSPMLRRDISMKEFFVQTFREATRQGIEPMAEEACIITGDWGFDLSKVDTPVTLWHGLNNSVIPMGVGQYLTERLPKVTSHFIPEEGNYMYLKIIEEIMGIFPPVDGLIKGG